MKLPRLLTGFFVAVFVVLASGSATAHAEAVTAESLEKLSKAQLIEMVLSLSAKIPESNAGSELHLRQELRAGMSGEEVRKLQQILATDPSVYPEGLVTGYFGRLTAEAVQRLHSKFKLDVRGEVNAATLDLINTLLEARGVTGTTIPHDLFTSGASRIKIEVKNNNGKIEYKINVKCDSSGSGNLCKNDENEIEDGAENDADQIEIEVEIKSGKAHVKVELDGDKHRFILNVTERLAVIEELAKRLELSESEIEAVIEFEGDDVDGEDDDEDD